MRHIASARSRGCRVVRHHERVTVGRGLGHHPAATDAAGARPVLDHDPLADPFPSYAGMRPNESELPPGACGTISPDRPEEGSGASLGGGRDNGHKRANAHASSRTWWRDVQIILSPWRGLRVRRHGIGEVDAGGNFPGVAAIVTAWYHDPRYLEIDHHVPSLARDWRRVTGRRDGAARPLLWVKPLCPSGPDRSGGPEHLTALDRTIAEVEVALARP